jgi:hypothetical protein
MDDRILLLLINEYYWFKYNLQCFWKIPLLKQIIIVWLVCGFFLP